MQPWVERLIVDLFSLQLRYFRYYRMHRIINGDCIVVLKKNQGIDTFDNLKQTFLPAFRWHSFIWYCSSFSLGMSFQVARNTCRSEEGKQTNLSTVVTWKPRINFHTDTLLDSWHIWKQIMAGLLAYHECSQCICNTLSHLINRIQAWLLYLQSVTSFEVSDFTFCES